MDKNEPRAVTLSEFERYQSRKGGGGDGEPPKSLRETIRDTFNDITFSTRKRAKDTLHRAMYANDGARLNELLPQFDKVVQGGLEGWRLARRINRLGLPEPR